MTVGGKSLVAIGAMPIGEAARFFDALAEGVPQTNAASSDRAAAHADPPADGNGDNRESGNGPGSPAIVPLTPVSRTIAEELLKEIRARLTFLIDVGLHYLTLDRAAPTLSGGEAQRIRLASQVGAGLVGVLYILDEPSIGLHPRDNDRLLATLRRLARLGNTVVVVEHDEDTMRAADHLVDFGPGPGVKGGEVIAQGTIDDVARFAPELDRRIPGGQADDSDPRDAQGPRWALPHDQRRPAQ